MAALVHLVVGSTGAGKSTQVQRLARQHGAVPFVIDEWMRHMFHPDRPADAGYDWYAPRIERSLEMIWRVVLELGRVGVPSVLEVGMTQRAARAEFYQRAEQAGVALQLHLVDAPVELRWQRVQARNRAQDGTFALHVTREMFDFVENMWEPPDEAELNAHAGVRHATGSSP